MLKNITDKLAALTTNAKLHLSYKLDRNLYDTVLSVSETFPESFDSKLTYYGLPVVFRVSEEVSSDFFSKKLNKCALTDMLTSVTVSIHILPLVKSAKVQKFSSEKFASWLNAELTAHCSLIIEATERMNSVREEAELFRTKHNESFAGVDMVRLSLQDSSESGVMGSYSDSTKVVKVFVPTIATYALNANLDDEELRAYVRAVMAHEYAHAYDSARNPALFSMRQNMIAKSIINDDLDTYVKIVEALEDNAHRFTPKFLDLRDSLGRKEAMDLAGTSKSADRQFLANNLQEYRNNLS